MEECDGPSSCVVLLPLIFFEQVLRRLSSVADLATGIASTGYSPASTMYSEEMRISEVAAELPLVLYAIGLVFPLLLPAVQLCTDPLGATLQLRRWPSHPRSVVGMGRTKACLPRRPYPAGASILVVPFRLCCLLTCTLQTLFAIGAALAPNPGGLFVLRLLGGMFGAMTITNLGRSAPAPLSGLSHLG